MINQLKLKNQKERKIQELNSKYDNQNNIKDYQKEEFDKKLYYNIKNKYYDRFLLEEYIEFHKYSENERIILLNNYIIDFNKYIKENKIEFKKEELNDRLEKFYLDKKINKKILNIYIFIKNKKREEEKQKEKNI